ncbi:hypothetical protein EVAR_33482_1 [Eumeta japonica]|uniref:Zinc finger BED domain-containing protein 4 n=1 Tax=Eumeta variegata TaxID=151549 RepID=A0A4C1WEE7_EUMVA|nr:hypothetical protein EVAR_33482_1 [Eumeta japonica]
MNTGGPSDHKSDDRGMLVRNRRTCVGAVMMWGTDISTRWDSTLQALRRLLEQRVAVQACLPRITCKAELTTEEWIMMEKVSSKIIRKYERFVAERRGEYIAKLAGDLLMALNERFEDLENEEIYCLATTLDPRKHGYFNYTLQHLQQKSVL